MESYLHRSIYTTGAKCMFGCAELQVICRSCSFLSTHFCGEGKVISSLMWMETIMSISQFIAFCLNDFFKFAHIRDGSILIGLEVHFSYGFMYLMVLFSYGYRYGVCNEKKILI